MGLIVDCICQPEYKDGYHFVQWIGSLFGDCIYTPLEKFSYYSGVISIIFYFIAFYPQIYENYKRKSTDGLSLVLIIIWFFGDFANYIGTVLTKQYPIQKIVGIYFALMEIIVMGQYLYYKFFYHGPVVVDDRDDEDREPTERDRLIVKTEGENPSQAKKSRDAPQAPSSPSKASTTPSQPPYHTYETFSDLQPSLPVPPPLDPVEGEEEEEKEDPSENNTPKLNVDDEVPVPENEKEPVDEANENAPQYETLDEISQKQQQQQQQEQEPQEPQEPEEAPVTNIDSTIDHPTNAFSTSVSSSLSQASLRNGKENKKEEDDQGSKASLQDSKESLEEDDDDEDDEESSSKNASSLSLDTKEGEEEDGEEEEEEGEGSQESLRRSESSLTRKNNRKKGRKGKKGKKGKRPKRGKGLSTALQTIALLSLFILQIQARAIEYQQYLRGSSLRYGIQEGDDETAPIRICDASPQLSTLQKVIGSIMAWSSGILYFTCRIPQILENKRNRSVEGVSIFLFLCTIFGNLFYGLSIIIRFPPINEKFFAATLPYLIGSIGTFIFDLMLMYQFHAYQSNEVAYTPIN